METDSTAQILMLTIEDIDAQEDFRKLLHEQKMALIALVHELSLALYKLFGRNDD